MKNVLFIVLVLTFLFNAALASVHPARIFSDNMVLQRDVAIPVWGTASPGEPVTVRLKSAVVKTIALSDGRWMVELPGFAAGGPYELIIESFSGKIEFKNVLVGDVWFASGQSNMEHPVSGWEYIPHSAIANYEQEITDSKYPEIRLFQVPKFPSPFVLKDLSGGQWEVANPQSVAGFSSTAWFFAKELYRKLGVPIGIIHSSWGGTQIQPWMSQQSLEPYKNSVKIPEIPVKFDQQGWTHKVTESIEKNRIRRNQISYSPSGFPEKAGRRDFEDSTWKSINLLDPQSKFGNILWLRKKIVVPNDLSTRELELSLGFLNRQSHVFFNGIEIGYFLYPRPAVLTIPDSLVCADKNILAVRLAQPWGNTQALGDSSQFWIKSSKGNFRQNQYDKWQANDRLEAVIQAPESYQGYPTYLYNGMVAPVIPYAIKGFIWYQGESNSGESALYEKLFQQLITDWRKSWQQGDLPFLFIQASNIELTHNFDQRNNSWCSLREAQQKALRLPNTGMVVSLDAGDRYDVHPKNKQEFGRRLALQAFKVAYRQPIIADGPVVDSCKLKGNTIIIKVKDEGSGLKVVDPSHLSGFDVLGTDSVVYEVDAFLNNNYVCVSLPDRVVPAEVRYGWTNNPRCSLFNEAGLPMAPFRLSMK